MLYVHIHIWACTAFSFCRIKLRYIQVCLCSIWKIQPKTTCRQQTCSVSKALTLQTDVLTHSMPANRFKFAQGTATFPALKKQTWSWRGFIDENPGKHQFLKLSLVSSSMFVPARLLPSTALALGSYEITIPFSFVPLGFLLHFYYYHYHYHYHYHYLYHYHYHYHYHFHFHYHYYYYYYYWSMLLWLDVWKELLLVKEPHFQTGPEQLIKLINLSIHILSYTCMYFAVHRES